MESNGESLLHPQKRRVKEETVLPDPRSHLWTLEPHHACLLGAEIIEKSLLLQMPSKTKTGTGQNNLVSPLLPPSILPSLSPNGWKQWVVRGSNMVPSDRTFNYQWETL